mgnify:CR=1 FL=1
MQLAGTTIKTPWSSLSVIVDIEKFPIVRACAFESLNSLTNKASFTGEKFIKDAKLDGVVEVIENWLDGDLDAMKSLKVAQPGGDFMQKCWSVLRNVHGGTVVSYQDLARRAGRPLAMRAAGSAMAKNLIAPIIPCHRVIKSTGEIGNYGFGVSLKRQLLLHEGIEL